MNNSAQGTWEKYPAALPADTILAGQYIIVDVLGQGGFGITYLAEDYGTKTNVAVKEYFPEMMAMRSTASLEVKTYTDERLDNFKFGMDSFLEEARVLAQFQGNPYIVGVQKYFEENGTAYFVMDYIDGIDFKTYIRQNGGKLSWEAVWGIMSPVMDALDAVHKKGLIHRDVTPDNILIARDGTIKLLDFGAARYSLGDRSRSLDVVLKPGYAPKEQYIRRGRQGAFTDVYSTAACFYAALSGFLPPESLERMEEDNLVLLSARGVRISQRAEEAIVKALEVRAEDRYQTMAEFRQALMESEPKPQPIPEPQPVSYVGIRTEEETLFSNLDDKDANVEQEHTGRKSGKKFRLRKVIMAVSAAAVIAVGIGIGVHSYRNGWHTRTYANGVYSGEFQDGDRHGVGTFRYANGEEYRGSWSCGEKTGQGKYLYANGDFYDGEWRRDERSGQGKYAYANGDVYDGEWSHDEKSGQGKYVYAGGDVYYDGEWNHDKESGQGKYVYTDGDWYEGEFQDGEFVNGQGRKSYPDGSWYEGAFQDGVRNGYGIQTYSEYDEKERKSYEGNWVDDERSGQGKLLWKDGAVYEGEFQNDMRNGYGIETYSGGDVYEGEFQNDVKSGQGKYTWTSGTVYEGEFKDGTRNGYGIQIYPAKSKFVSYEGYWVDAEWSGQGTLKWKSGDKWEGEFKDDLANGNGTYTWADGSTKKITYKDGKAIN